MQEYDYSVRAIKPSLMQHPLFYFLVAITAYGQAQELTLLSALNETIKESSGLLYLEERIITHNDSGGAAALYEITTAGTITRTVTISNATNVDWEDITADDTHIYIGDFGNNSGTRTNLKIYCIGISEYLNTVDDTVAAQIITYSYADQTDFTSNSFATNFDAEALIAYQDNLYIFTKNWGNQKTNIYSLPKAPGDYSSSKIDELDVQGLITGASFNTISDSIVLTGYTFSTPFIVALHGFNAPLFSNGTYQRYELQIPAGNSIQMEGITSFDSNHYYLSAEEGFASNSGLYILTTGPALTTENHAVQERMIFPNPAKDQLYIQQHNFTKIMLYDLKGVLQKTTTQKQIDLSDLESGVYCIRIQGQKNTAAVMKKVLVK